MTTNDIIAAVRRKALETSTDVVSTETILLYANESYRETRRKLKMSADVVEASIVCSNGTCTLPADYGAMYTRAVDSDDNTYEEVSIADYDANSDVRTFTIKEGSLLVNDEDLTALTIRYYPKAATLTTAQDPEIDEMFHEIIVYGALWRVQEDLQDEELATYYQQKELSEFKRKSEVQSSYEEANQRGGQMFTEQRLI